MNSEQFKDCVIDFFAPDTAASSALASVDWATWYHTPGLPPKPDFKSELYDSCAALASRWKGLSGAASEFEPSAEDVRGWTAWQAQVFLDILIESPSPIPVEYSPALGSLYGFQFSGNLEVVSRYLRVALRAGDGRALKQTEEVLGQTGRMKFVKPL